MSLGTLSLDFESLRNAYDGGSCSPHDVVDEVFRRIEGARARVCNVWLHLLAPDAVHVDVARLVSRRAAGENLPLFGIPFAVKDNIDVAALPTTAACPDFAYTPLVSAHVVQRLVSAGAVVIGKVNLDQFAMGLVGVRSPYGTPTNPFDGRMIPGGSSSGSAVAVATGQVSFSLGTDTAGSGRVPAAFNNVVGLKPSKGALSTRGVVPACRSLDCISVFALTVSDACIVASAAKDWDELDPFCRFDAQAIAFAPQDGRRSWRIGIPSRDQLVFFDDAHARAAFDDAVERLRAMDCTVVEVDFGPFREAGEMLYGGPWVAERLLSAGPLLERKPEALLPVIRGILLEAGRHDAFDVFAAGYRLRAIRRTAEATWRAVDALLVPTAPTIYRIDQVVAEPRALNANLGVYTTFVNLMDLAAIAVPAGFRYDRLPSGVTFIGPRGSEPTLAAVASAFHSRVGGTLGATAQPIPSAPQRPMAEPFLQDRRRIAVVGAHLSGQPLNHQLTALGGNLVRAAATAPCYRLYALRGTIPAKPGLARVREGGRSIDIEVWSLDERAFGAFVGAVPRPLCIGSVELDDGSFVSGFLCEPEALIDAADISHHGGWRAYVMAKSNDRDVST
jgi:allophanate hydrolase